MWIYKIYAGSYKKVKGKENIFIGRLLLPNNSEALV